VYWLFILLFLIIPLLIFILMSKDKKITIQMIVVMLSVYFSYYIIGYLLDTDMLNAITPRKGEVTFSFIGFVLLFVTTILVKLAIDTFKKRNKK
jgi:uncharacterized membrane protein (DUF485 family)